MEEEEEGGGGGGGGGGGEVVDSLESWACFSLQEDLMAGGTCLAKIGFAEGKELELFVV
jgi:hypothetical protein